MTALYAEDPQSHSAQANTMRRLIRVPTVSVGRISSARSTRSLSVITPRSTAQCLLVQRLLVQPETASDEHLFQCVNTVREDPIDTGIDESLHGFGVVDGPDLDLLASSMNGGYERRRQDRETAAMHRNRDRHLQHRSGRVERPRYPRREPVSGNSQCACRRRYARVETAAEFVEASDSELADTNPVVGLVLFYGRGQHRYVRW